jgi:NAD(P)-dependent dehydrogenase (short-subunit alcohol dehydrogenase family)
VTATPDGQPFEGRIALVTGASGGIGAELSARLAAAGAAVGVHYSANREAAERVAATIAAGGGRAAVFAADLRDATAPERLVEAVEAQLGPVDVLAANAGLSRPAPYEVVDAAAFDETLAVACAHRSCWRGASCPACAGAASGACSSRHRSPGSRAASSGRTTRRRRPACTVSRTSSPPAWRATA